MLATPTFALDLSFDMIIVGGMNQMHTSTACFLEEKMLMEDSHRLRAFVKSQDEDLQKKQKEDAWYAATQQENLERLLTTYGLSEAEYQFTRFYNLKVSDVTYFCLFEGQRRALQVNFYRALNRQTTTDDLGQQIFVAKATLGVQRDTIFFVCGNNPRIRELTQPTNYSEFQSTLEPTEKYALMNQMIGAPAKIHQTVKEMFSLSTNTKAVEPILNATYRVALNTVVFEENFDSNFDDLQIRLWDAIFCRYMAVILLNQDLPVNPADIEREVISRTDLEAAATTLIGFSLASISQLLNSDSKILKILLHRDTFLYWLLFSTIDLKPDLDLFALFEITDQHIDSLIRINAKNKYLKLFHTNADDLTDFYNRFMITFLEETASIKKISQFIRFLCSLDKRTKDCLCDGVSTNDQSRETIFNTITDLMVKIRPSSISNQILDILKDFVVEGILRKAPQLLSEFFRHVSNKRALLTIPFLRMFFTLPQIEREEKIRLFSELVLRKRTETIGDDASQFVGELIKDTFFLPPTIHNSINIIDVFVFIDELFPDYPSNEELINFCILEGKLTHFHQSCLIAFDQKRMCSDNIEECFRQSRLQKTYLAVKDFLLNLNERVFMSHLLSKNLNHRLESTFEALNEEDYSPFKLKYLKLRSRAINLAQSIRNADKLLEENFIVFTAFDFTKPLIEEIKQLQESFPRLSLEKVQESSTFKKVEILQKPAFTCLKKLTHEYDPFLKSLRDKSANASNLFELDIALSAVFREFEDRFRRFEKPKSFNLQEYEFYFKDFDKREQTYVEILPFFGLPEASNRIIISNCTVMKMFKKILYLTESLEKMTNGKIAKVKPNSIFKNMKEVKSRIKTNAPDQITLQMIVEADTYKLVRVPEKQHEFLVKLPWLIEAIADAPDLMEFIRTNGDKFIKFMREEVDNENMEVVNRLDNVNNNVKFVFNEDVDMDKFVNELVKLGPDEQEKTIGFIRSLEGLVKNHIQFLADKTKKDSGYNNKMIGMLLFQSNYYFSYIHESNEYGVSADCTQNNAKLRVNISDLNELLNKSMIMVSEKGGDSNNQDEVLQRIQVFSKVGKCLIEVKYLLKILRDLGIIFQNFSNILYLVNDLGKQVESSDYEEKAALNLFYTKEEGLTKIKDFIEKLRLLAATFEKQLRSYYKQESYLLSHFSGKTLHYLIEYLTGKQLDKRTVDECLNIIREAHPAEGVEKICFEDSVDSFFLEKDPIEKLKHTHKVLVEWTREIVDRRNVISKPKENFFSLKKVLISRDCSNMFLKILKILRDCQPTTVSISQFLFCSKLTTPFQILAFTKLAILDKFSRPYFIIHLNKTGYSGISEFRRIFEVLSDEEYAELNTRIVVFIQSDPLAISVLDYESFSDAHPFLDKILEQVSDSSVRDMFSQGLSKLEMVMSEMAGMGKSTYIQKKAGSLAPIDIFLAGEVNSKTIDKRLQNLAEQPAGKNCIIIKLDFIEEFQAACELVDFVLLCICLLGKVNTHSGCFMFNPELIFLEVGNTFAAELLTSLGVIQFIAKSDNASKVRNVHRLPEFKLENISFDPSNPTSNELIACNYFGQFEKATVSRDFFLKMVQKYLIDKVNSLPDPSPLTFSKYQFWLKTIAQIGPNFDSKFAGEATPELAREIFEEIVDYGSRVVGLSAKNVRTSQDLMVKLVAEVDKEKLRAEAAEKHRSSVNSLVNTWKPGDLIVPLYFQGEVLIGALGLKAFDASSRRHGIRTNLKKYGLNKNQFVDPENILLGSQTEEYLSRLAKVTGKNFDTLKQTSNNFRGTGFSLTAETYLKICLILSKAALGVPIILMGESGCGKTHLAHFVAEGILGEPLFPLTLYSGVTEGELVEFMKGVVKKAKDVPSSRVWVLFDEFNTSPLQILVSELMLDRECPVDKEIRTIPENVRFIACCNPFRLKTRFAGTGLASKSSASLLSHRVYPIPERLIDYVWDFGQLAEEDEKEILKGIVKAENVFKESEIQRADNFCAEMYKCHKFVRDFEERSGVSLRDIKRVMKLYRWFENVLKHSMAHSELHPKNDEIPDWAFVSSIMVCYALRLNGRAEQSEFIKKLTEGITRLSSVKKYTRAEVLNILPRIADIFLECLRKEGNGILPPGTALNKPLKENFIAMLASVDTITPLIICGAPGTSKTLSTHILCSSLVTYVMKKYPMFGFFKKGINQIYYGGSESSTSEGISLVFRRGEKYIENGGDDTPVVVFDEIGLAEIAPANPLKVLHPLLEQKDAKVGFIGLSNWTLDLSKMNRLIYIARPDLELSDLNEVFQSSLESNTNLELCELLKKHLHNMANAYLKFRVWQRQFGLHPDFHGTRDVYSAARYLRQCLIRLTEGSHTGIENQLTGKSVSEQAELIVKLSIERNFGGEVYYFTDNHSLFSKTKSLCPLASVPHLEQLRDFGSKPSVDLDGADLTGSVYLEKKPLTAIKRSDSLSDKSVLGFSSDTVFKAFLLEDNENSAASSQLFRRDFFLSSETIFKLINSSVSDYSCRYLLVRSEGQLLENILIDRIRGSIRDSKIVDWRGVAGRESRLELFSSVKSYITLGYFLIMKGLDELYGSLYDLFNQHFVEIEGRKYCYLYFGESKHRIEVHPNFSCLIFVDSDYGPQVDIELRHPAPFLNRFEKYMIQVKDVFPGRRLQDLLAVKSLAQQMAQGRSNRVVSLSLDMIASICLNSDKKEDNELESQAASGDKLDQPTSLHRFGAEISLILRLATLNVLQNQSLLEDHLNILKKEHAFKSLRSLLLDFRNTSYKKLCLFTFSNPVELDAIQPQIEKELQLRIRKSGEFFEAGLEARSRMVREHKEDTFLLQFTIQDHLALMPQIKSALAENSNIRRVLFLIHLDRSAVRREGFSGEGINCWDRWENYVMENISSTDYPKAIENRTKTLEELILSEKGGVGKAVLQEVVLTSYQRLAQEKVGQHLKDFIQPIRRTLEVDEREVVLSAIRQKLKEHSILDREQSWLRLVAQRNIDNKDYIDFEKEILLLFLERYGEKTRKLIHLISTGVKGFPGYTFGVLSKDKRLSNYYFDRLAHELAGVKINPKDLDKKPSAESCFKVPFLSDVYKEFNEDVIQNVLFSLKDVLTSLSDNHHKLSTIRSRAESNVPDTAEVKAIKELINKGEEYFASRAFQSIQPIILKINTSTDEFSSNPQLREFISEDLIEALLSSPKLRIPAHLRQTSIMLQFCRVAVVKKDRTEPSLTDILCSALYLLGTSCDDVKLSLETLVNANVLLEKIKQAADSLLKKSPTSALGGTKFDLPRVGKMLATVQTSLIPALDSADIPDLRFRLESTALNFRKHISLQADKSIDKVFQGLAIALGLIEILPEKYRLAHIKQLENIRQNKEAYGDELGYKSISSAIEKIVLEHATRFENPTKLRLLVGEYVRLNAQSLDFTYFKSTEFDETILRANTPNLLFSLTAVIARVLATELPVFWSTEKYVQLLNRSLTNAALTKIDQFLRDLTFSKNKFMYLVAHLVDQLYLRAISEPQQSTKPPQINLIEAVQVLKSKLQSLDNFHGVDGIASLVILRLFMTRAIVDSLPLDRGLCEKLEVGLDGIISSKDDFFLRVDSFIPIYLLQTANQITDNLEPWAMNMKSVRLLLQIIGEAGDTDLIIASMSESLNKRSIKLGDLIAAEVAKEDASSFSKLILGEKHEGSASLHYYAMSLAMVNRFLSIQSTEFETNIIENQRRMYINAFSGTPLSKPFTLALSTIIMDKFGSLSPLLPDEKSNNPKTLLKLKKTIAHILLSLTINERLGMSLEVGKLVGAEGINNMNLLTRFSSSENLSNFISVFSIIIKDRIGSGNLGIYQCSCKLAYSIGNCGFAMEKTKCPRCGQEIGGSNHQSVNRDGHKHIKTLEEFYQIIMEEFKKNEGKYRVHSLVSGHCTEMFSKGLAVLGLKSFIDSRTNLDSSELVNHQKVTLICHLVDHIILYLLPSLSPPGERQAILSKYESSLDLESKVNRELIGKVNGAFLVNPLDYFVNHIKNDFYQLQMIAKTNNFSETLDFVNAVISSSFLEGARKELVQGVDPDGRSCFKGSFVENTTEIVRDLEKIKGLQMENHFNQNKLIKDTIQKRSELKQVGESVKRNETGEPLDKRTLIGNVYPLMRHTNFDRVQIIDSFKNRLENSQFNFLRSVVNYQHVLRDFPRMVMANLELTLYLNQNYNRVFTFDETTTTDILSIQDPHIAELFQEFKATWTTVIPKHEDSHPDVFSFAFMCNQNLNVAKFIDRTLSKEGSRVINFLMVDSSEEFSGSETLYMKGIIRTFLEGFHNKLIAQAKKVLGLEEALSKKKLSMEFVTADDLVTEFDFEEIVLNNVWVCPDFTLNNEINFNFEFIEYTIAREFLRSEINCEEADIKFYNFKNSKVTESEQMVRSLSRKVGKVDLTKDIISSVEDSTLDQVEVSLKFVLEIGEYISQNFIFDDPQLLLCELLKKNNSTQLGRRFGRFDESRHSQLKIGHISEYYTLLKERHFVLNLALEKKAFSKPIPPAVYSSLQSQLQVCSTDRLAQLMGHLKDAMKEGFQRKGFGGLTIGDNLEVEEELATIKELRFASYFSLADLIQETYDSKVKLERRK